jgi:penicillin-binding protein 1A
MATAQTYKKWIYTLAIGLVAAVASVFVYVASTDIPDFAELENPKYDLASVIYDAKGQAFGRYYIEDRVTVPYSELSPHVVDALISTEDSRFFDHSGVDLRALFRVGFKTIILRQESSGGGSTISQQLAKLLYKRPNTKGKSFFTKTATTIKSKLKEWVIAVKLEKSYTKEEIIAMYLNKFEFINGAHGIEAAADIYFSKKQKELNISEAATLVGMLKNPSLYNPRRFPEKCADRRNVVLELMHDADQIDKETLEQLRAKPIDMSAFQRKTQSDGPAPYFRAELTKFLKDLFNKKDIRKSDGSEYNVYTDGLKIHTTIDLTYQKYAEEAVLEHMRRNQERFDRVWKNRDPWTFEADDYQKKLRASIFESQCKGSDRYLAMREKAIGPILKDIDEKYHNLPLSDNVIKVLDSIQQNMVTWHQATTNNSIDVVYQSQYHRLINDPFWPKLIAKYTDLQKDFKKIFSQKVKMKVFDYEKGEKEVEMSPFDSVRYHKMHLQAGMMVVDPLTGYVKAWVGGINHKYFKYDHVTMRRSVGSTIKPFVYTQALAVANVSPCQEYEDIQYTISPADSGFDMAEEWSPSNAEGKFTGRKYNLIKALELSKNSITVKLLKEMGTVVPVRDLLHNVGVDKNLRLSNGRLAVPNLPSICLGSVDLTLMEMTGAYTPFANNGGYTQPVFISRIEDKNGKVIYQGIPVRKSAINPLYNAVMLDMLKNNISGMNVKSQIGGKTGTTNDFSDGWFMGVTPTLVAGVWTGGDDKWIRFLDLDTGQGSVMAKPIVSLFLRKLENDTESGYDPKSVFTNPPEGFTEIMDCGKFRAQRTTEDMKMTRQQKVAKEEFGEEF